MLRNLQKILNNNFFIYILLFLFAYYISSGYLGDINILFSFDHYTVKEYFLIESKNYNFNNHFNYGVEAYGKSLISSYYKIFQVITFQKIDLLRLQQITIFFEIVLYFFSFYYLQNTIFKTSQKINAISSIIFTFSSILLYNFANFKLPHYFGIHYQFSMSFAMLAIASCIEEKKIQTSAFAFLSLGFHFIIGIYSFLFISIYLLISKKVRY